MENKSLQRKKLNKYMVTSIAFVVMVALLLIGTGAWYVISEDGDVSLFGDNGERVADWDFTVSETSGGDDVAHDATLSVFTDSIVNDTSSGKLAPGARGSFKLYVRSATDVASSFELYIDKSDMKIKESAEDNVSASVAQVLSQYLQSHICFYSDSEYENEMTSETPLIGSVDKGQEKPVVVYWEWHFDGSHLVDDSMTEDQKESILKQYDKEDLLINNYRNLINGEICIKIDAASNQPQQ